MGRGNWAAPGCPSITCLCFFRLIFAYNPNARKRPGNRTISVLPSTKRNGSLRFQYLAALLLIIAKAEAQLIRADGTTNKCFAPRSFKLLRSNSQVMNIESFWISAPAAFCAAITIPQLFSAKPGPRPAKKHRQTASRNGDVPVLLEVAIESILRLFFFFFLKIRRLGCAPFHQTNVPCCEQSSTAKFHRARTEISKLTTRALSNSTDDY